MLQYLWIPFAIVMYSVYAWLTKQNNLYQTPTWFIWMWIAGSVPLWNIVSRNSTHLLTDGFLYDIIILLSYVTTMIILGEAKSFVLCQWLGLVLCILGIIMMKLRLF